MFMLFAIALAASAAPSETFRGLTFGELCPNDLNIVDRDPAAQIYYGQRNGEKLSIGAAALIDISYGCWNHDGNDDTPGVLASVFIRLPPDDAPVLKVILTEQWGEPYKRNKYLNQYLWNGPIRGYLDYSSPRSSALGIQSGEVMNQVKAAEKARAASASEDL